MRINKISRLRYGVFRDFKWSNDLSDDPGGFGRYNLIYGWNGSGKTTISQIFRALERHKQFPDPEDPEGGEVKLTINDQEVSGGDFPDQPASVRVFNRDFIEKNIFSTDDIDPIIVGEENIEKQERIEELKKELDETQELLKTEENKKKEVEHYLIRTHCPDQAKSIKHLLGSAGSAKENPYNNYDKGDYKERAEKMLEEGDAEKYRLNDEDREKYIQQSRDNPKSNIEELEYRVPDLKLLASGVSALLGETVASKAIQSLKDDQELSKWVSEGFDLHKARGGTKCLYCEQEIPKERLDSLERHFDDSYRQLIKKLDDKEREVKGLLDGVPKLSSLPDKARFYDDLVKEYENARSDLEETLAKIKKFLGSLNEKLKDKKGKLFEKVSMNEPPPAIDNDVLGKLNSVIDKHNQRSNDIQSIKERARERLEKGWVADSLEEYRELKDKIQEHKKLCEEQEGKERDLDKKIQDLEREIKDHQRPAKQLNDDLRGYLGHKELQLKIEKTGYTIVRHGDTPAKGTLSEGEKTAIALLYFLKSLEDHEFDIANGVVVLDDPVSSLDDSALHLAVAFIKERAKGTGQLFVFTHNFMFFRLMRDWFDHIKPKKLNKFYMLDCIREGKDQRRPSRIQTLDPLLKDYKSEYHYLFACIYLAAKGDKKTKKGLEHKYPLPNMARRLLETFLEFHHTGNLWQKLEKVEFDEIKKKRILQLVNVDSHGPDFWESDGLLLNEVNEVLDDILKLIKHENSTHYETMKKLAIETQSK